MKSWAIGGFLTNAHVPKPKRKLIASAVRPKLCESGFAKRMRSLAGSRTEVLIPSAAWKYAAINSTLVLVGKGGVTDGTRTRNSQNHNLELYH